MILKQILRKFFSFCPGETVFLDFLKFEKFEIRREDRERRERERERERERDVQVTEMSTYRCIGEIERYVFFIIFSHFFVREKTSKTIVVHASTQES